MQIANKTNQQFLQDHTKNLALLASHAASTLPIPMPSTVAVGPTPPVDAPINASVNDPKSDTDSDVEIMEVRVRRRSASDRHASRQLVGNAIAEDTKEEEHLSGKSSSSATGNQSSSPQTSSSPVGTPYTQLLIDNKLYTTPSATQFPLRDLSVTSFSRALYSLNGHYHPRDLSQPLILKAYKSFIFSQYVEASFDDKVQACCKVSHDGLRSSYSLLMLE